MPPGMGAWGAPGWGAPGYGQPGYGAAPAATAWAMPGATTAAQPYGGRSIVVCDMHAQCEAIRLYAHCTR